MQTMEPTIELRIWEKSSLIGKTKGEIDKDLGVSIIKVARGTKATNPSENLIIEAADYVTFIGNEEACAKMLDKSAPSED